MYAIETKKIDNKLYIYATRRVRVGKKYKKISVYIGKTVPKTKSQEEVVLQKLFAREVALATDIVAGLQLPDQHITNGEYEQVEKARITHQYNYGRLTPKAQDRWWRAFTVRFIFESNKIEGSRLSESEVSAIVRGKQAKKSSSRDEVREVENALEAMALVRSGTFVLNERTILKLHALITRDLGIETGFKKRAIIVNNKNTTAPGKVRKELAELIRWWKEEKDLAPFYKAALFHQRFELIYPFEDGNGRTGRFLLLWMLIKAGYDVLLLQSRNRKAYFSSLKKADVGQKRVWLQYVMKVYKTTVATLWQDA